MAAHSDKYLRRIEDLVIAGEVADITQLEEDEKLRVVYNIRRKTKKPLAMFHRLEEVEVEDKDGNVKKVKLSTLS